jgi:hypothetical protein
VKGDLECWFSVSYPGLSGGRHCCLIRCITLVSFYYSMVLQCEFILFREDVANAAIFGELRSRIQQVKHN